jgi:hypothetical protein
VVAQTIISTIKEKIVSNLAKQCAKNKIAEIARLMRAMRKAEKNNADKEPIMSKIYSLVYALDYRSGWSTNTSEFEVAEFMISLCIGGPVVYMQGEFDDHAVCSCKVLYRDWSTKAKQYKLSKLQQQYLKEFAALNIPI